jgi:hypothetical protein
MKRSMATIGVVATVGATIVLGTVVNTAPANAALLNFNFLTRNGATGSFTLNTSIQDTNPASGAGLFQNAITNLEYPLFGISDSEPLDLRTFFNGPEVVIFDTRTQGGSYLSLYLDYDNPDQLSDDPNDYFISTSGSFAGYGGLIGTFNSTQFSRIIGLTVNRENEPTPVPEPGTVLGLGLLGMWPLKRILSSLKRT